MANLLTAEEYIKNTFSDPDYSLIRAVRVDSPNSNWKKKSDGAAFDVQVLIALIKTGKKQYFVGIFLATDFEADGTTLKKDDGTGKYLTLNYDVNGYSNSNLSKKELEEFIADKTGRKDPNDKDAISKQMDVIDYNIERLNKNNGSGPWSVIQDPWDPSTLVEATPTSADKLAERKKNAEDYARYTTPEPQAATASGTSSAAEAVKIPPINPITVSGKFILKVKSGPGVIIGDTEVDIAEGKADFSGIQFDQAGDYVISISCTSPDVEATEISLKVLPPPEAIPQESKGATESNASGTRPIIAQIDRPTIELPSMVFPRQDTDTVSSTQVANGIGLTPFLNYNGSQINDRDIQSFTLYHDELVPKVDIIFRDTNGMISKEPPRDDTKFEIFLNSRSQNLKSIHLKFKIANFSRLQSGQYSLSGTLDISELYRNKFKVIRGTSFEALREICKNLKLGFNSNIDNTSDSMAWRNIGDKEHKFMTDIIKHSYISDESFMAGYIDFYYCFNYVDIEKEMKRSIDKDVGIDTGGVTNPSEKDSDKIVKLILTSEKGQQTSNMFFSKKAERNKSTQISMEQGYKTRTKFYDRIKKMFLVFDVDSTTSDGEKSLILKGAEGDKEAFDNNYVTKYNGKIDTDNTHKNYNYAVTQNRINLDNMMKNQLDISLPNPNFNLYRFQKIQLFLVKEAATVSAPETIQWRYSGEWLIASIKFVFMNGGLTQEITLARKEMGKNPEEIKQGTNNGQKETKDKKSENPIIGTASATITNKPNERYKVGDVFTVQDSNGKKYILTITKLSENGTDVVTTLRDPSIVPNQAITGPDTIAGVTQSADVAASVISEPQSGKYPYQVMLNKREATFGEDFSQALVTSYTGNFWNYSRLKSTTLSPDENLEISESIFIAIKRPKPSFKPTDKQKGETPYSWVLFELNDYGARSADMATIETKKKYEIVKSRLLESHEYNNYAFSANNPDLEYLREWSKPKGYIKIIDESGKVVVDSSIEISDGGFGWGRTTGIEATSGSADSYSGWYAGGGLLEKDQEYTNVGGRNTIYYDLSNEEKYKPGVYTIELKYYVPVYEFDKYNRIMTKGADGYSAHEEKILREKFTIVKKPSKR